jgi:cytochrome c oxidase cbb3-type subunit 3
MSRNAVFVDAGKATFTTTCVSCHKESLRGVDEGGIGANLVDNNWIHGNKPTDLLKVVDKGVLAKGMPAWGPVIGAKKNSEVVAYILSHHQEPAK